MRELVDERNKSRSVFDKTASGISVGDIAHLFVRDIKQPCEFFTVAGSLIQHDYKLRVGKHSACLYGIKKIFHVLSNSGRISISLSELSPCGVKELRGELIFKDDVELVDEYMSTLAFLPVERNPVQHRVGDNKQSGRFKL